MEEWAVFKTGGKQYKVSVGDLIAVEKVVPKGTNSITFDQILLFKSPKGLKIGKPFIEKAKIQGKVLEEFKDRKIKVVKFKPKSRYLKTQGHRQTKTRVLIEKIES